MKTNAFFRNKLIHVYFLGPPHHPTSSIHLWFESLFKHLHTAFRAHIHGVHFACPEHVSTELEVLNVDRAVLIMGTVCS